MAETVLITVATNVGPGEMLKPVVISTLREYLRRLEAGEAGNEAEEAFSHTDETGKVLAGVRIERADTQLVADYLESLRSFAREAPAAKLKELFPAPHSVAPR